MLVSFLLLIFSIFLMIIVDKPSMFICAMAFISLGVLCIALLNMMIFGRTILNSESKSAFDNFLRDSFPNGYSKNYITCCAQCHILQSAKDILIVHTGYEFIKKYEIKNFTITNSVYDESAILVIDDNRQKLVLLSLTEIKSICKETNYEDLLSVSLETDGQTIFEKSTMRTVAGATVGGALFGGAGAVVGGLSGNTNSVKAIGKIVVKFVFRDIENPNYELVLLNVVSPIKPTDLDYNRVKKALALGNKIKDIGSIIIDKVDNSKNEQSPISNLSVAEELKKFADLVKEGIISQKDFEEQKKKLLKQ